MRRLYLGHAVEERSSSATLEQVEVVVRRLYQGHAVEEKSSSATLEQVEVAKTVDKTKEEDNETLKDANEQVDETQNKTEEEVTGNMD